MLIDRNQPPDTQLWYAPPDSTDYQYLVHMYWRGVDNDGTVERFIWTIKDTLATDAFRWSPATKLADFRQGHITTRTDSIFAFTAYKDVSGVGVRRNRQAFYVASIDDNGVIDPVPAAIEFIATIGKLPEMRFVTYVDGKARPYKDSTPPADTVGMFKPFQISYHGVTTNGKVNAYKFFSLNSNIDIPNSNIWSTDLTDTLRSFTNTGVDALPAGDFKFAARCIDDANAQSAVDATSYKRGVAQVIVNFDPNTFITEVKNTVFRRNALGGIDVSVRNIDFTDANPDTVPYKSWIYYRYNGVDDPRDGKVCSVTNPDKCIDFQIRYVRNSARVNGAYEDSYWMPSSSTHDSDPNSATDSNSVNIGSYEYDWYVRSLDENKTPDGTPPHFHIIGNYDPTLDTVHLSDQFGNQLNVATVDTLRWDFYKGIGWPYTSETDTFQSDINKYYKKFAWTLDATGHDDPRDPAGSGIQSWRYYVYTDYNAATNTGTFWPLGRAGDSWFPAATLNVLDDRVELTIRYDQPDGSDLFANLPGYFNQKVTIVLYGRDTQSLAGDFSQYAFWTEVPPGEAAGTVSKKNLINSNPAGNLGRWTPRKVITFYLKFYR